MEEKPVDLSIQIYRISECVVFYKTRDPWGEFSNMCRDFPVIVQTDNGRYIIPTTEALYQSMRFPDLYCNGVYFQQEICKEMNPMKAKMIAKRFLKDHTRPNWDEDRIFYMEWVLRLKLLSNFRKFSRVLLDSGDLSIVEYSKKDSFWGAKPDKEDPSSLVGRNILGKLLMKIRGVLRSPDRYRELFVVRPPDVVYSVLYGSPIATCYYNDVLESFLETFGKERFWKNS